MTSNAIEIEIVYPHPVANLWTALTTQDALAAWLMPNDFEPALGHSFTFQAVSAGGWNGRIDCTVTTLTPLQQVAYTWRGDPNPWETLVTFTLEPAENGTRLRLEHSGFEAGGKPGLAARDMMAAGWDSHILRGRLPAFLQTIA